MKTYIDSIKTEIKTEISDYEGCSDFNEGIRYGLQTALEIIDKYISGCVQCVNCENFNKSDNYCKLLQINFLPDGFGCNKGGHINEV